MTERKFFKKVIQIVVLSQEDEPFQDLDDVCYAITEGSSSGGPMTVLSSEEIDGKQAADELKKHGSDPSFFELDEDGNDE